MRFPTSAIATCLLVLAALVNFATPCTDTVYVATGDAQVVKSVDGGNTWSTVLENRRDPMLHPFYAVSAQGDNIYAGTDFGLLVSNNGGASWSTNNLQTVSGCDSMVESVFVDDQKRVYVLFGTKDGCGRVAISSDNGVTWPTNFKIPFTNNFWDIHVYGSRIYVASSYGLGYTDDSGATWTMKNQASGLGSDTVYAVTGKGQTIYAGLAGLYAPVSASFDGGDTWKTVVSTHTGDNNQATSMYLQDDTLYVGTNGGGVSWSNDFATWTTKTMRDGLAGNALHTIVASGNNLYAGTYQAGLSISRDNGQSWVTSAGLPSYQMYDVFAQCV